MTCIFYGALFTPAKVLLVSTKSLVPLLLVLMAMHNIKIWSESPKILDELRSVLETVIC